ncbi:hypothetical protein [Salinispora arenicola]|uniref:hypothetical protein n=1 Tax=Salinispora arenicola TaxID=168697 RepID=UPI0003A62EDC|nr:hypothetical protein [Salinispora arenicola]
MFDVAATVKQITSNPADARSILIQHSVRELTAMCREVGIACGSRDRKPVLVHRMDTFAKTQGTPEPTQDEAPASTDEVAEPQNEEPGDAEQPQDEDEPTRGEGFIAPEPGAYLLITAGVATRKSILFLVDAVTSTDNKVEATGRQFLIKHRTLSPLSKTVTLRGQQDFTVVLPAGTTIDDEARETLVIAARPERFGPGGTEVRKGKRPSLVVDADTLAAAAGGRELTQDQVQALAARVVQLLPELISQEG